jgi:hypothetical protein
MANMAGTMFPGTIVPIRLEAFDIHPVDWARASSEGPQAPG